MLTIHTPRCSQGGLRKIHVARVFKKNCPFTDQGLPIQYVSFYRDLEHQSPRCSTDAVEQFALVN